jgi:hypothetical protein
LKEKEDAQASQDGERREAQLGCDDRQLRERAIEARERERRGTLQGGLILIAIGTALTIMMLAMARSSGAWSIGLIPFLIGVVLLASTPFLTKSDNATRIE